jgi:hypothetical protein
MCMEIVLYDLRDEGAWQAARRCEGEGGGAIPID